jgi:hypothetical protein
VPPVPLRRPFRGFVCLFLGFLFVCSFARAQLKRAGSALIGDGVQRTPGRLEAFGSDAGAHVHSSIRPGLHRTSRAIRTIACCATATGYTAGCTKRATGSRLNYCVLVKRCVGNHGQPARDRDRRRCSARHAAKRRRTATRHSNPTRSISSYSGLKLRPHPAIAGVVDDAIGDAVLGVGVGLRRRARVVGLHTHREGLGSLIAVSQCWRSTMRMRGRDVHASTVDGGEAQPLCTQQHRTAAIGAELTQTGEMHACSEAVPARAPGSSRVAKLRPGAFEHARALGCPADAALDRRWLAQMPGPHLKNDGPTSPSGCALRPEARAQLRANCCM